ncbi:hypothetical protein [Patulibacter sp. SYSU D01012]|uniref:hypothetical protein n=1 Tax=Patulibacter sp. SYSU D01012 TaxID=2817381 RepID=UPI001B31386C|nr:hypothetical protein [Patulibacter sp. SYSU D01012]
MSLMITRTAAVLATSLALLVPTAGAATASSPAPTVQRDLHLRSTGAPPFREVFVAFVTTTKAARVQVWIDGRRGSVTKGWTRRVVAFSSDAFGRGHFRRGHRYTVRIRLWSSGGESTTITRRLKLQYSPPGTEGP